MGDKRRRENRGRAKKPRRSGRKAIKDPKVVDPKNRPSEEEMYSTKSGGRIGCMEPLVYKTIDLLRDGVDIASVEEVLKEEINPNTTRPFSQRFVRNTITVASGLIRQRYEMQREEVVSLHIKRYNDEIKRLLNINTTSIDERKKRAAKIEAYMNCLDVLQQKEKLLGMHLKEFRVVINNEEEILLKEKGPKIDLTKLTLQEKLELNALLEKSRGQEEEVKGVILHHKDSIIEDVECEVVDDIANVEKMENKQPQRLPDGHTEDGGISVITLKEKLNIALKKRAQQEFLKAGSRTADMDHI